MKAFLTNYEKNCALCGTPKTDIHHCIPGVARRKLADADDLTIPLCRKCHDEIHANGAAMRLSKIVGQLAYELNYVADKEKILDAREHFRKRYGKSYL